jgi:hypothetical protein
MNFLKKQNDVQEVTKDTLGGGFTWDTGAYPVVIDSAYLGMSSGGAANITFNFKTKEGKSLEQTIYVSSGKEKGQLNYYIDQQGEKKYLPGFVLCNDIALVTLGKDLSDLETEDKIVEVYDTTEGKKVPKEVPVFMELIGSKLTLGVVKVREFRNVKDAAGNYVQGDEIREFNEIDKVFSETNHTVVELKASAEADFFSKWVEKRPATFIKDKTKSKNKQKAATASTKPKKSLFNK